jgi:hypothetical protein
MLVSSRIFCVSLIVTAEPLAGKLPPQVLGSLHKLKPAGIAGLLLAATDDAGLEEAGLEEAGTDEGAIDEAGLEDAGIDEGAIDEAGLLLAGLEDAGVDEGAIDEAAIDDAATVPQTLPDTIGISNEPPFFAPLIPNASV